MATATASAGTAKVGTEPIVQPSASVAKPSPGLNTGIRITIAIVFSIVIGIFALLWDGRVIPIPKDVPYWLGSIVFTPILAFLGILGTTSLVQGLSCGSVDIVRQAIRAAYVPIPFLLFTGILYLFPSLRWPIEGLAQSANPAIRRGLSSGFYTFWIALYTSGFLNGFAQIC